MGACATRPGDLKVKGEAPLVVEDAAGGEKKVDPADVSRRRSLSDLLKEDAESDGEAPDAEEEVESAAAATDHQAGATEEQLVARHSVAKERDTAAGGDAQALEEEEKRVDPGSLQVDLAAAATAEESKVADAST